MVRSTFAWTMDIVVSYLHEMALICPTLLLWHQMHSCLNSLQTIVANRVLIYDWLNDNIWMSLVSRIIKTHYKAYTK